VRCSGQRAVGMSMRLVADVSMAMLRAHEEALNVLLDDLDRRRLNRKAPGGASTSRFVAELRGREGGG